jgi:putative addiction module CopG family antidote
MAVKTLQVVLPAEQEAFLRELVEAGLFGSPDEAISAALPLLKDQYELYKIKRADLRQAVAVGIEQLDRGEKVSAEEVFRRLREKREKREKEAS